MAWKLDFVPGAGQAMEAGHYFSSVANDLVDEVLSGMTPHNYRLEPAGHEEWALRIWAYEPPPDELVLGIVPLIATLRRDVSALFKAKEPMERVAGFFQRWLNTMWVPVTLFIEKIRPRGAFSEQERIDMSIALLGGRLNMFSTEHAMFVEHASGTFGLAVAGQGSYLLENLSAPSLIPEARK